MLNQSHISVIIPALNEEKSISLVVSELQALRTLDKTPLIDDIIVCDNGSTDNTAVVAALHGARVVYQSTPGYGIACLTAMSHLQETDIVVFLDGDYSCVTEQAKDLLQPFISNTQVDMVIGSRALGSKQTGALTLPQTVGNALAVFLIRYLWKTNITDLGPFRAIRYSSLKQLQMADRKFGWTVEMQVKAILHHMNVIEIPVDSIRRIGVSKISGTLKGVFGAGVGILSTIGRLWWEHTLRTQPLLRYARIHSSSHTRNSKKKRY